MVHEIQETAEKKLDTVLIENIQLCNNRKIMQLFRNLKPYENYVSAYLHGSWADNTNNAFSDIDDFIIIHKDRFKSQKELRSVISILNKIDIKFCRIDPIQHHGHWIVCNNELDVYNNSFMPLYIMKEAKRIQGDEIIKANIDKEQTLKGLRENIIGTCKNIERLSEKYFLNNINAYELKCLVGSFVLVPAFIFQLKNEEIDKPGAIAKSHTLYSVDAFSCITWSTNCRENWDVITGKSIFKIFAFLVKFCPDPHIWRKFAEKFSPKVSKNDTSLLSLNDLNKRSTSDYISESLKYLDIVG
ncbi:nucleotidyltransferase domain-containing protein [Algibacter mikhailovii]|uniref:Polymerase beta nucleotidyltransferase domain-containing protein n=1 Tax=Algibacter mikhailovii TaxID=425498 RepID=A0A918R7J8_9FLAO|nr:nucleotidyltransferase domain-containing protein [Algibacter mikhailovii]GGZ89304.1 hypothetical protein GCM10007028_29440 [Algibacter mikhailovii]